MTEPKEMFIYLIQQGANRGYDTYDSAVVVAPSASVAVRIHPSDGAVQGAPDPRAHNFNAWNERWDHYGQSVARDTRRRLGSWTLPENVTFVCVGRAAPEYTEPKVLCASFNAG